MPNVDRECVTHHICDCLQAKLKKLESELAEAKIDHLNEIGRKCVEAIEFTIPSLKSAIRMMEEDGFNRDSLKGKRTSLKKLEKALSEAKKVGWI